MTLEKAVLNAAYWNTEPYAVLAEGQIDIEGFLEDLRQQGFVVVPA